MSKIVHEAETQRQHPRYKMPVRVELFGKQYIASDISVGGVGIKEADFDLGVGRVEKGKLIFPMDGYSFTVEVDMELRYVRRDSGQAGFRFQNIDRQTVAAMRNIFDGYIGGEVVQTNDMLTVLARDNSAKERKQVEADANAKKASNAVPRGYIAMLLACLLLAGFIMYSLYNRMFVNEVLQADIAVDTIPVRAPAAGQLSFVRAGEEVVAGDTLAALTRDDGTEILIPSPCDCFVMSRSALNDAYAYRGDVLFELVDRNAVPFVRAVVSREDLMAMYRNREVIVTFADGSKEKPTRFRRDTLQGEVTQDGVVLNPILIETSKPLTLSDIGTPVSVRINRARRVRSEVSGSEVPGGVAR